MPRPRGRALFGSYGGNLYTFNPTGSWDTWASQNVTVTLNSETGNTIRLQSNGSDLSNLDPIAVN